MKYIIFAITVLLTGFSSCKKFKQDTCQFSDCDSRRVTKVVAEDWAGKMVYNNEINKWGIYSLVQGNAQRRRIAFICGSLNDSFKILDKEVRYSGYLKESCDNPRSTSINEEIFYVEPSLLR